MKMMEGKGENMLDIQATVVRAKVNVADADTLVQQGRMGTPNVGLCCNFGRRRLVT